MTESEQSLATMLDAYKAAVLAKDVDAFIALYDAGVCVFDLWGAWSYAGASAWRSTAAAWFESLGTERVAVEMADVQIVAGDEVAVVHAFVTYQGLSADGQPLRAMVNRLTWALRRHGRGWKIVHEHTSAPADPDTTKVVLQR